MIVTLFAIRSRLTVCHLTGLLIECDPSIKAMILKYDEERHDYIVEDLDDENHLVIKESQLENLKVRLDQVSSESLLLSALTITHPSNRT
jgi:TFIIH basal transcription factor complex TTD-A subunit